MITALAVYADGAAAPPRFFLGDASFLPAATAALDALPVTLRRQTASAVGSAKPPTDNFLGCLLLALDHKVFGWVTNTNTVIILCVKDVPLQESRLKTLLRDVHRAWVNVHSGPSWGKDAVSPRFAREVAALLEASEAQLPYTGTLPF